jgi:putative ABC transport system substrate-binding protein
MLTDFTSKGQCPGRGQHWTWCVIFALPVMLGLLLTDCAEAKKGERPFLIGALTSSWGPSPMIVGLRDGLIELGYREEVDFTLGIRFTQGDLSELPAAAQQLVTYGADLIFADDDAAAKAAQEATTQIPIVFASVSDPMALGAIDSFARPGGNVTGVTDLELRLGPKRLQVFQEMIPSLQRVLFVYDAAQAFSVRMSVAYREAASRLGITLVEKPVRTQEAAKAAFDQVQEGGIDGLLISASVSLNIWGFAVDAAAQHKLPAMFSSSFAPEQGGLVSYATNTHETGKQAARLVDKILNGIEPANLPVEVNTKIEFVINLKTAQALGLTIPPEVLYRADRLIR